MTLAAGRRLGSYEIVAPLGAGGMGEVYRARDTRLGRDVAIKVLPADVTADAGRLERFDREARVIAALNHPHIVTIYSTEDADGVRFLTMELVEGTTLTELIIARGLPVARFLEIALPLADALTAAHQKQITHRDLKPGNVMVSHDGRVKVLDFGLARVGGAEVAEHSLAATRAPITQQGMIVGTMPYMSPEQVEGRPLDPRSDLFSLGVIFYELLSGARPFTGSSSPALMSAILRDTPTAIAEQRPDVPDAIARLVSRLIEKRPEDRVQTARDVFNELKHVRKQVDSATARPSSANASAAAATQNLSVAVLPFTARGGDSATSLADGLTDDITTALARFPYLKVISRAAASDLHGASRAGPAARGAALGARFLLEGAVRIAGESVRVSAHLSDTETGAHLWAETFDRDLAPGVFAVQDDVVSRMAATVADASGVLVRTMGASIRDLPLAGLGLDDLVLRYQLYTEQFTAADHAALCDVFEAIVAREPGAAQAWACLGMLVAAEMFFGLNSRPQPLERLREYVERATVLDSSIQLGWTATAVLAMFDRDRATLDAAAERATALNPLHTRTLAVVGVQLAFSGETDRGVALLERAMALNPRYPGWYLIGPFLQAYERGEYETAHRHARRIGMPKFVPGLLAAASAAGQTGSVTDARAAVEALVRTNPGSLEPLARRHWETLLWDAAAIDQLVEGFAKALSISGFAPADDRSRPPSSMAGVRAAAVTVAVLPLVSRSSDDESKALAEGLTDDITAGLSKFGYLQVLSRSAAERLARAHADLPAHARYAIEGHVRRSGATVRITLTLVDTQTAANLWTNSYDRDVGGGMFTIQDDVASAVVATIGDQTGVLMRAMATAARDRPLAQLSVAELVVRYHLYAESFDPAEHVRLREAFERALERAPRSAEGWACLSFLYEHEHSFGFNPLPDSRIRERQAAERAHELDPNSQQAWIAMAGMYCFARDRDGLTNAVERAAGINPLNADLLALGAIFLSVASEHDRATVLVRQAMALKPHHAGWYYYPLVNAATERGDYQEALGYNKKINMPRMPLQHANAAAFAGHLGLAAEARAALHALRTIDPRLAEPDGARAIWAGWVWSETWIASNIDGFMKARALDERAEARSDAGREQSIAVLPFTDLSETKDQDWFCDGVAEEILNALARLPGLKVIARTSAFAFKGQNLPIDRIAATLGVTSVLSGSVRRVGSRIRVAAQLVTAADGSHLWSERYDRELADVFAVQDDIAAAIAKELRVRLTDASPAAREYRPAVPAYEAFLMGRHQVWRHTPEAYEAGYRSYERAIALDPGYADPHVGIAELLHIRASLRGPEAQQYAAAIRPALERALALDPRHPEANAWLGIIASTYEHNWREAEERFGIAMGAEPVAPYIRHLNAYFRLRFIGRAEEAVAEHHRALESDPLNLIMRVGLATSLTCAGRHADAAGEAQRLLQLAPEFVASYTLLPLNVAEEPLSVSLPYAEQLHARAPWCAGSAGLLAGLLRRAGDSERAAALLREVDDAEIYGHAVDLVLNHLACGEVDQAFGYLPILANQHHPFLMMILIGGPYAAALRASPRWPAFAATVGLAGF